MHRFQVATGVKRIGKRRILTELRVIAGFDRKHVLELLDAYLENHYNLTQCTVLSNSDGGRGYTKDVFDELAAGSRHHEHFRDRYHVNEKIRQRLGWVRKRGMVDRLHYEVWKHDWEDVRCCLDMLDREASNAEEEENVRKLRAYLVLISAASPITVPAADRWNIWLQHLVGDETWSLALLVLCAGIRRFFGSREGRPRRSRRDNAGCCRSWGGARGRWGPVSWSVAAAFDRQGKAIGCEPPARDERVCPPGGEPSRVDGYRSFSPSGRPGWVLPAANPYGVGVGTSCIWRGAGPAPPTASQWVIGFSSSVLFTLHFAA